MFLVKCLAKFRERDGEVVSCLTATISHRVRIQPFLKNSTQGRHCRRVTNTPLPAKKYPTKSKMCIKSQLDWVKQKSLWSIYWHFCKRQSRETIHRREYQTIYRGSGFLADILFGSSPNPSPLPLASTSCLSLLVFQCVGRGGVGGGGARSYDDKKASFSINNSILYDPYQEHPGRFAVGGQQLQE